MHTALTRTLREQVVECLQEKRNDGRIRLLTQHRIESEFPAIRRATDDEQTSLFLRILSRDGVYGASESLLALAMLYKCDIIVHREHGYRNLK